MWWSTARGSTAVVVQRAAWCVAAATATGAVGLAACCVPVALADAAASASSASNPQPTPPTQSQQQSQPPTHTSPAATTPGSQPQKQHYREGTHWRIFTSTGKPANLSQVVSAITREADVCLLGEVHDDAVAHALQLALLQRTAAALGYRPAAGSTAASAPSLQLPLLAPAADAAVKQQEQQQAAHGGAPCCRRLVLSLEQFDTDVQPVVNEFMAGCITLADLLRDARPWSNHLTDYQPLLAHCKALGLPVVAANAPRRYVSLAGREGSAALERLPHAARAWLPPLPHAPPSAAYVSKVDGSMRQAAVDMQRLRAQHTAAAADGDHHQRALQAASDPSAPTAAAAAAAARAATTAAAEGEAPLQDASAATQQAGCPYIGFSASSNFMAAQSLWDATMAHSIARALSSSAASASSRVTQQQPSAGCNTSPGASDAPLIMHMCGKFHCEHRLGIPEHLAARYAPTARTIVVVMVPWSGELSSVGPAQLAAAGLTSSSSSSSATATEGAAGDFIVLTDARVPRSFDSVHLV